MNKLFAEAHATSETNVPVLSVFKPGGLQVPNLAGVVQDKTHDIPVYRESEVFMQPGTVHLNATQFHFSCGMVPEATFEDQAVVVPAPYLQLYNTIKLSPFLGEIMLPLGERIVSMTMLTCRLLMYI